MQPSIANQMMHKTSVRSQSMFHLLKTTNMSILKRRSMNCQIRLLSNTNQANDVYGNDHKNIGHKICLIVGTGDGLGSSLAKRFAFGGYKTIIVRRNLSSLQETANKIEKEVCSMLAQSSETNDKKCDASSNSNNVSIIPHPCDARKEEEVVQLFKDVESKHGPIDVCIFNVGANISFPLIETTSRKFHKCWEMA